MIKKDYEVSMHEDRSVYGVEWDINVPRNTKPVIVAQDVFGEVEEYMQLLVYPSTDQDGETENALSVRFNPDGSMAGVVVPDGIPVCSWDEPTSSDWLNARDGDASSVVAKQVKQAPKEPEPIKLRSVIRDLSDVLEAHAVHGDHSPSELQEWADTGRRAIGDYKETKK